MKSAQCFMLFAACLAVQAEAKWTIECAPTRLDGVYKAGEKVTFQARLLYDGFRPLEEENYAIRLYVRTNSAFMVETTQNAATDVEVSATLDACGWISVHAEAKGPDGKNLELSPEEEPNKWRRQVQVSCGAMVAPEKCRQGAPEPKDFDAYWAAERAKVLAAPANAKLVKNDDPIVAKREGYYLFSADLPGPFKGPTALVTVPRTTEKGQKFPVLIFVHGTGVHVPSRPDWGQPVPQAFQSRFPGPVIRCNLNAHGYELNRPPEFYKELGAGVLKDYQFFGSESDETWYMKGLVLRLIRTIDEMCKLPEWDGENVIVCGGSQGGAQALLAGGIDRRVNFVAADVPAMCDFGGHLVGHADGWPKPYFVKEEAEGKGGGGQRTDSRFVYYRATSFDNRDKTSVPDDESCETRFGYCDAVNFAARINPAAHVVISAGGYDGVCPPTGVFAAYGRCPAKDKQIRFAPLGGHCQGDYEDGQLQLPAEWKGDVRVDKNGFDPVKTVKDGVRTLRLYAYNTYRGPGRNASWKYLNIERDGSRMLTFTGTNVVFVSNGRSWSSIEAELFLDGRQVAPGLKAKVYRHQPAGVRTTVVDGCTHGKHVLLIRPKGQWKWCNLGIEEFVVSGPDAEPPAPVWSEMSPFEVVNAIYGTDYFKSHLPIAPWMEMKTADFLPFIDKYGQFKFRDWPGKTKDDAQLKAAADEETKDLAAHPGPAGWDEFGGWTKGPKLAATGRFYTKKLDGKWWLVDPKGHLFWSFGAVRVTPSSAMTPLNGRNQPDRDCFFEYLPAKDDPFAKFYETYDELLLPFFVNKGETHRFDFSSANLCRKYGPDYYNIFADLAHRRLRSWGANTIANSSDVKICLMDRTPYAERVECLSRPIEGSASGWWKFRDPWDVSFKEGVRASLEKHGREAHDPWCIGFFVDNEINWGKDDATLARWVLDSPAEQPARVAFVDWLKARGRTVETVADSDLDAFGKVVIDAYFSRTRAAIKAFDPQLLYLGCRFGGEIRESVMRACAKYVDVVSSNVYKPDLAELKLPAGVDAPIMIGEFHFGALDRGPLGRGLQDAGTQAARGEALKRYVRSALRHPNVVGVHWHQFSDQATTGRFDGENFQVGWTDICDTPYPETVSALREIGENLYPTRAK